MTIRFEKEKITSKEMITRKPFVGYFSPSGELIELGNDNHEDLESSIENTFLTFISYVTDSELLHEYRGINDIFIRQYNYSYDYNPIDIDYLLFKLDSNINYTKNNLSSSISVLEYKLLLFFLKAYKNKSFFETIDKKIIVEDLAVIKNKIKLKMPNIDDDSLQVMTFNHLKKELLSYFKDICVEYLGYDSIERFDFNGNLINIPKEDEKYDFNFLENPRVITSSYPNINDRFFNYLIMNWHVKRVSRFRYNEITEKYEEEDSSSIVYQSDNEQMLEEEIKSIKRKVPLKERYKYFR